MKKIGNQVYRAHPKSMRDFGDAIDWSDRPKSKEGRTRRRKITRLAHRRNTMNINAKSQSNEREHHLPRAVRR
jgi:hypothetical protein